MSMAPLPNSDVGGESAGDVVRPAPYASRYVEAGGLRLRYLDYGAAGRPALLCVHGGGAHAHWFDFVATGLCADYHVLAIDQRGHGDSAWAEPTSYAYERFAADLHEAVDKLDLNDFVLIGHSMGGTIALMYAAAYPGRVRRLVVVDSTVHMTADRVAAMREVGARRGSTYANREEFIARFRLRPAGTRAAPDVLHHVAQHSCRQHADGSWRHKFDRNVYATRETINGLPCWDHVGIPALLVKGDLSDRISPQVFAEVKKRCPQAELAEVSNSDHHVTLDNPAGFVRAVKAFLHNHAGRTA